MGTAVETAPAQQKAAEATTATNTSAATQQQQPPAAAARPVQAVQQQVLPPRDEGMPLWIDRAIWAVVGALIYLLWKKFG